ncbi:unnamed protein product [Xylocopa violacea]|uniref:Mitochondrial genome maintenance exonuclease 1 n=1 Tax=Xylocopa violacea TaxID=135666 RepID=A0ABP1NUT7_XYLVO
MFRLCQQQNVKVGNWIIIKLNIRTKKILAKHKNNSNSASREKVEAKGASILPNTLNSKCQSNQSNQPTSKTSNNNVDCTVQKKIEYEKKIVGDITSFSIFSSEATENDGIQIVTSDMGISIPSVTYILNQTMSDKAKTALQLWEKNIIDTFGEEYFKILRKELLDDGKLFHSCVQNILLNKESEIPPHIKPAYFSIGPILKHIQTVHAVELYVTHPVLRYKGIIDCIVSYRDQPCIIDWKKSRKQKASLAATFDAPIQLAAYIGAINASNKYSFRIDRGLIVVAYTTGEPASIYELKDVTLQKTWTMWLRRLEQFYMGLNETTP